MAAWHFALFLVLLGIQPPVSDEEQWRLRLKDAVRELDGDFDRFVNSLLYHRGNTLDAFARTSDLGRMLDHYYQRTMPKMKGKPALSMGEDGRGFSTPFHDFEWYCAKMNPRIHEGILRKPLGPDSLWLAKSPNVKVVNHAYGIILSEGDVELMRCGHSIIVSGANVSIGDTMGSALIIASGDVKFSGMVDSGFVICGGKIVLGGEFYAFGVSAEKIELKGRGKLETPSLILDGKPKPAPELFTFRDLWMDYGFQAVLDQGRVRITNAKADGPFSELLRQGDVVLSSKKVKIDSAGQFRRLLGRSLDIGSFDFDIDRAGKTLSVQAGLKKESKKR